MIKNSKLILPIIFITGAIVVGVNMVRINKGYAQTPPPQPCDPLTQNCGEDYCNWCSETGNPDESCGDTCDGGGNNERPSLECTGLNVAGEPAPGVSVK